MTPEQIAEGLSEAQRQKLDLICRLPRGSFKATPDGVTLGKHLVQVHSRHAHPWAKVWLEPTSLGLAIRKIITKEARRG